jgi:hypothetical protein
MLGFGNGILLLNKPAVPSLCLILRRWEIQHSQFSLLMLCRLISISQQQSKAAEI